MLRKATPGSPTHLMYRISKSTKTIPCSRDCLALNGSSLAGQAAKGDSCRNSKSVRRDLRRRKYPRHHARKSVPMTWRDLRQCLRQWTLTAAVRDIKHRTVMLAQSFLSLGDGFGTLQAPSRYKSSLMHCRMTPDSQEYSNCPGTTTPKRST